MAQRVRHFVFLSPLALLLIGLVLSLINTERFFSRAQAVVDWLLQHFDWLFSWSTFLFVLLVAAVYFSPLGKQRIGGEDAQPILSRWRWFAITLCTTIATGILFWGTAEPIYHLSSPPVGSGDDPAAFAMSTLFMHWTITPYAIYTVAGLSFALAYYTHKQPFSLSSMLYPLVGERAHGWPGQVVDAICLFALVAGMAASLGAGILTLDGGLSGSLETSPDSPNAKYADSTFQGFRYALIGLAIVAAFLISAASGLQRGIRILSTYNALGFIALAIFVLCFGPTRELFALAGKGLVDFITHFLPRSTNIGNPLPTDWQHSWTVFYWANWFAWAPISALFLGRLSVGYRVREYIQINLLWPSLFGALWMIIFGGSSIHLDLETAGAFQAGLTENGPESLIYQLFGELPATELVSGFFLLVVFLSYVTAADSNISAMGGLSVQGISPEQPEAPLYIRLIWGLVIGLVSWVMITFAGIDGIKLISTIGGFPAMLLIILVGLGLLRLLLQKFGRT
ncbi:MAG: BCCT family transporter [Bacteroidota bacterium]